MLPGWRRSIKRSTLPRRTNEGEHEERVT
jgi:hypothetical protein